MRVVLVLCCSLGFAQAGGCSGDVDPGPASQGDAAGGSSGRGGAGGLGGTDGRGGGGGLDVGGAAGRGGASAGAGGSSAGSGGFAAGGSSGRSAGGVAGVGPAGASGAGAGGASGSGSGCFSPGGFDCAISSSDNPCIVCAKVNCCSELVCCAADSACSGANGDGEITCIQDCVLSAVADGGVADNRTVSLCASRCARGGTISVPTNDLLACFLTGERSDGGTGADCFLECLAGD